MEDAHVAALLVRRCIAGDAAAWEEIVQQYNRRIYNICYRFTGSGNDAEDLTQEVFIKIYRTLNTFDANRGAFMTWVTTVTRNLLVDHFRKARQERMTDSLDTTQSDHEDAMPLGERIPDQAPTPDSKVQSRETREVVHAALQKLSPEMPGLGRLTATETSPKPVRYKDTLKLTLKFSACRHLGRMGMLKWVLDALLPSATLCEALRGLGG